MEELQTEDLFEPALIYPDPDARERLARLVGLDDHKDRLSKILTLLVAPGRVAGLGRPVPRRRIESARHDPCETPAHSP